MSVDRTVADEAGEICSEHSIEEARRLFDEHGVSTPVASFQAGLLTSQGEKRQLSWDLFRQRLAMCRELGVGTIVVVAADIQAPLDAGRFGSCHMHRFRNWRAWRVKLEMRAALEFQGVVCLCQQPADCSFAGE